MSDTDALIQDALKIAAADLRWCYRDRGIISGTRLVYWSWDSFFASFGANYLGDTQVSRKNIELYLGLQSPSGSVPKRIANPWYWLRFLKIPVTERPEKQRPTFWNSYYTAPSLTQNPTCVIAFHDYVRTTDDKEFIKAHKGALEKIFVYLKGKEGENGLLKEGIGGGWAESVLKRGAISFTNMCYARSLWCMSDLCRQVGDKEGARRYLAHHNTLKATINHVLWSDDDGGYYSDWYGLRRHHHFATDGNLLAVVWEIADRKKAGKIQAKITELALEDDIPIRLAYDKYSFWRVYIFNRLGGIKDYHVGFCWSWLGCIDVMAKIKMGKKEEAVAILTKIATVIVRDGTVHEIYDKGKAVHTPLYKSEKPWAWGAGLFIAACYLAGFQLQDSPVK